MIDGGYEAESTKIFADIFLVGNKTRSGDLMALRDCDDLHEFLVLVDR